MLYRRADVNFNGRFVIDYGTTEIEFLLPVFADRFCIIAPSALPIPGWMAIFRCYSVEVWCLIIGTLLIGTGWWYLMKRCEQSFLLHVHGNTKSKRLLNNCERVELSKIFTQMIILFSGGPIPMRPRRDLDRLFVGSCLVFSIIIVGTFQVNMTFSATICLY